MSPQSGRLPGRYGSALLIKFIRSNHLVHIPPKRCSAGATLAVALCVALSQADTLAQGDQNDWPTYNRDVIGTRHNAGERTINRSNAGRLEEKWRFPAKG